MTTTDGAEVDHLDDTTPTARPARPRWSRPVAVGVPSLVLAAHASFYGYWVADDAGITFAYARSIAGGLGPVLQPGAPPVEGFSNPLWLAVLTVARWLGVFDHGAWFGVPDLVAFPKLIALACCAGVFACFYSVARGATSRPVLVTVVAGTVTAAIPSFAIWCFSGMENALFALFVVALAATLARAALGGHLLDARTATTAGLLAAGAGLTRPDGLIYVTAFPLVVLLLTAADRQSARRWAVARSVSVFAIPCLAYLLLRLVMFGDWLPATVRSKVHGPPAPADLNRAADVVGQGGWLAALAALVVVTLALRRAPPARPVLAGVLVPLALAVVAFAVLPADWMWEARFATPIWPLAALVTALAATQVLSGAALRVRVGAAALAVLVVLPSCALWVVTAQQYRAGPVAALCPIAYAEPFRLNAVADALDVRDGSFVGVDAGAVALASRLRFVDGVGLTDARVARFWQARDMPGLRDYVFDQVRPTFYMVYSGWDLGPGLDSSRGGPHFQQDPRFARDYAEVAPETKTGASPSRAGVWVRREVVRDPAALIAARRANDALAVALIRLQQPGGATSWYCPSTLRPESSPAASGG